MEREQVDLQQLRRSLLPSPPFPPLSIFACRMSSSRQADVSAFSCESQAATVEELTSSGALCLSSSQAVDLDTLSEYALLVELSPPTAANHVALLLTVEDRSQYGVAPDRLLEENQAALAALDQRKRARKLAHVPTDDKKVRIKLREFEQPVTLFGEMVSQLSASLCWV